MQVQDVDLLAIDHLEQCGQRRGIELGLVQVGDVDAERLERFLRQVLLPQADERDVEARLVEARDHPREQPLHPVHARPFPAEVIADLQDVELAARVRSAPAPARRGRAWTASRRPTTRAGIADGDGAGAAISSRTTAPAPTIAPIADRDAVENLGAGAEPRALANRARRATWRPCSSTGTRRIAEVVVAADQVAVRREQRVAPDRARGWRRTARS